MSTRPIRLWDAKKENKDGSIGHALPYCYYSIVRPNAHWGALKQLRWAKVGTILEIINQENGRTYGSYLRGVNGIFFDPMNRLAALEEMLKKVKRTTELETH